MHCLILGIGSAIAGSLFGAFPRDKVRPVAKGLIRGGLKLGQAAKEWGTAVRVEANRLVEEAQAEIDESRVGEVK